MVSTQKRGIYMSELAMQDFEQVKEEDYMEDEFGIALKGYLIVRIVFYLIGTFAVLGGILAFALGATTLNDLVSNATALNAKSELLNSAFDGLQICMFVQAFYTVASLVCVTLFYIKRTKLFAFIDVGLFVILVAVFVVFGAFDLLFNGSAWMLYMLLNPLFSFAALFIGKHFNYMPMK